MDKIKVILSPNFSENEYYEEVSGITFRGGLEGELHCISLGENKLTGIQSALRKNILIPYDKETLDFVNGNDITAPEEPEPLNVLSVASVSNITAPYGTALGSLGLPVTLETTLSDNSKKSLSVNWDNGTPVYDGNTAGTYNFKGELVLVDDVTNTNGTYATATVIVEEDIIEPEPEVEEGGEEESDPETEVFSVQSTEDEKDLESLTVDELKSLAKEMGLTNYSKLKRDELIALIEDALKTK